VRATTSDQEASGYVDWKEYLIARLVLGDFTQGAPYSVCSLVHRPGKTLCESRYQVVSFLLLVVEKWGQNKS